MMYQNDTRMLLHAFFRQKWKFLLTFAIVLLLGISYIGLATPQYQSTAKLLVKFGQDNAPKVNTNNDNSGSGSEEHHELVQSNVNILSSRDLAEALLNEVSIERVYPKLAQNPPVRGTLMDAAVKQFTDDLIVKTESDSDIINIGIYNTDPALSQEMLRRLTDLFITRQSEIYADPHTGILRAQTQQTLAVLEAGQKRLYDYKNEAGIASIDDELSLLLKQRSDLTQDLLTKERFYALYKKPPGHGDPAAAALRGQKITLDKQILDLEQRKARYDDLEREVKLAEDNYRTKAARMEEAEVNQGLNQQKITRIAVIEQPILPYKPGRPPKTVVIALCLLAGILLGGVISILAEGLDQRFSLPEQASAILGIPVLASFTYLPQSEAS